MSKIVSSVYKWCIAILVLSCLMLNDSEIYHFKTSTFTTVDGFAAPKLWQTVGKFRTVIANKNKLKSSTAAQNIKAGVDNLKESYESIKSNFKSAIESFDDKNGDFEDLGMADTVNSPGIN